MKFEMKSLALAIGFVFAAFTCVIAMVAVLTGTGLEYLNLVGELHPGWSPTVLGALIMTFWMFIYGLIGGALVALIYNYFAKDG